MLMLTDATTNARTRSGLTAVLAVIVLGAACACAPAPTGTPVAVQPTSGSVTTTSSPTQAPPATKGTVPPTFEQPTAAADLASFFAAVDESDQRLTEAADAVNASFHGDLVTFDQSTIDAIGRAQPKAVAAAIPAGLDPAVEQAVLLVYSDLVSRFAALNGDMCVQLGTYPRAEINPDCFTNGHEAAVSLPGDTETARALAAASPATPATSPDSPAVAETMLRISYIDGVNMGCGSKGGFRATEPLTIEWNARPAPAEGSQPIAGSIQGGWFHATYDPAAGWVVGLYAC